MRRRTLLGLGLAARRDCEPDSPAPTDDRLLNAFAEKYNRYVETLKAGLVDLKQWKRVREAWERLR